MSRRNWYLLTNSLVLGWVAFAVVAVGIHRNVDQPLWLIIHVPLLGAATAAILIWSQHFSDTLLRRPAPGGRIGLAVRLTLHTVGAVLVIVGILRSTGALAVVGAVLVGLAIVIHAVTLARQYRAALPARFRPLIRYYIAASVVFIGGIAVGIAMVLIDAPETQDRLASAHLVLNGFGWIGLTVLGTLVLLWPTVLHARISPTSDPVAGVALPVLLVGIALAVAGPALDMPLLITAGMVVWLLAAARIGVEGLRQARALAPATFASWSLASAYAWLLVAVGALAVIAAIAPDWQTLRSTYYSALPPLVVGFGVQIVLGALSFLLPVVALGSPAAAKAGAEMLNAGAAFRVVGFNGAILVYLLPMPSVVRVLLSLVAAGIVIAFIVLALRAIVSGRRVRRDEGAEPDRSGRVQIGMPQSASEPPPRHMGAVTAAFTVLALCVAAGIAADPAATGIDIAGGGAVVASGETTEITVQVDGMRFVPAVLEVPYGNELVVTFENTGADVHDLTFANGARTQRLAPGLSEVLDVGVIGAQLDGWCSIAGHRQMGMELSVVVTGAPDVAPDVAPTMSHDGHGAPSDLPSAADDLDLAADPGPGFTPWPAALSPAPSSTVHRVTLSVTEHEEEVAPGVVQQRWTFGGTSPGPVLRGSVGDRFEVTLVNDGSIGHSIDFHAGELAPDEWMRTIQPGESLTLNFTATRAGIWMYHCSTMPMSMHIANGMFGAVIIDPPDLAPVDREYLLVQGELYLGPQGETADADLIALQNPDLVVFNGYANQYVYAPLPAAVGERVRVWVLDAGPNRPSSFHVVGAQFDTTYLEGAYTLMQGGSGGSQSLALQPAQGGFVELEFTEAGVYPFVTHIMSDSEKGASGTFVVG